MPDDAVKPALRAALRCHEIGRRSPYEICFAGKANSGGSFGFMQGDLAAGGPVVRSTFRRAMAAAGMAQATIDDLAQRLSTKGITNTIITPDEKQQIDAALGASRALVDAMDEAILGKIYGELDTCIDAAASGNRTIDPVAQLYIAMWVNMTGPPSKILDWLRGTVPLGDTELGETVEEADIQAYLQAQKYYLDHPQNFPHMVESADKGAEALA
jgi:hypothetical protein